MRVSLSRIGHGGLFAEHFGLGLPPTVDTAGMVELPAGITAAALAGWEAGLSARLLAQAKVDAAARVAEDHGAALVAATGGAGAAERDTWAAKAAAATAFRAGSASPEQTDMLTEESTLTGETMADLATLILSKSRAYHRLVGKAAGIRRNAEAAIEAATTMAAVAAAGAAFDATIAELG